MDAWRARRGGEHTHTEGVGEGGCEGAIKALYYKSLTVHV